MQQIKNERGSTLTIVSVIVSLLLISSTFLLSTYVKGSQSVHSQESMLKAHYLAESGLAEAIQQIIVSSEPLPDETEEPKECAPQNGNGNGKNKETCVDEEGNVIPNPDYEHPACKNPKPGKEHPKCNKAAPEPSPEPSPEPVIPIEESLPPIETGSQGGDSNNLIPMCRTDGIQHNPSCVEKTPEEWAADVFWENEEMAFSDAYQQKGSASWFVEGKEFERLYYIQATGIYGQAETTIEAGIYLNAENQITIQFIQEI